MKSVIGNSNLEITVKHTGAELSGIRDSAGTEYMWQGNPDIWSGQAPVLFPVVGKLNNNTYIYDGQTYRMGLHGFARNNEFKKSGDSDEHLSFTLEDSEKTRGMYPFKFNLNVLFRLSAETLEVTYEVINRDKKVMPFSIGAHPAFAFSWGEDDRLEDYYIQFNKKENAGIYKLDENFLLSEQPSATIANTDILRITKEIFDEDALIFKELESDTATLRSDRHSRKVQVEFPGFPHLGIWAKPSAPYVCIEPWHGHADPSGYSGDIMEKPGIIKLQPGKQFSCRHRIKVILP